MKLRSINRKIMVFNLAIIIFTFLTVIFFVNYRMKQEALAEAEAKALIILKRNLAIHTYFNTDLKPKLFDLTGSYTSKDFFDPIWMSSTFAVRKINEYAAAADIGRFYYKECAINARSPLNEADGYERDFIQRMNADPAVQKLSAVRTIEGKHFFTVLLRGEKMENLCMRCHSTPDNAPGQMVAVYGAERSFNRSIDEIVSAISIRIPLDEAYSRADRITFALSGFILVVIVCFFGFQTLMYRKFLLIPLMTIRDKAVQVANEEGHLGETIQGLPGQEFQDTADAFNKMSVSLSNQMKSLESTVRERTSELEFANSQLISEVNEHALAQESLRAANELLDATISSLDVAILIVEPDSRVIIECNQTAESMFGYSRDEILGRNTSFVHLNEELYLKFGEEMRKAARTTGFYSTEYMMKRKDGSVFPSQHFARPMYKDGVIFKFVSVIRDISELKKAEQELIKMQKLESLGVLAGGIAHDFNNLLGAILGNIDLALMYLPQESTPRGLLLSAEESCNQAKDLSYRLLTFSKGGDPYLKVARISRLIMDAVTFALSGSNVSASFFLPDDLHTVLIDEGQIKQVFHNLAINAMEAMPKGGIINVSAENIRLKEGNNLALPPGLYLHISFCDHGKGIPKEILSKIFDPYFSTKEMGSRKGQGLGLTICHSIIKRHNGIITIDSVVHTGSTFHIYLPAAQSEQVSSERQVPAERLQACLCKRALVMDDDKGMQNILEKMLKHIGFEVLCTGSGEEAIQAYKNALAEQICFDFVILDLTVPSGMGGIETINQLRALDPEVRGIIASGYANDPIMTDFAMYGFIGALAKPFSLSQLSELFNIQKDHLQE